MSDFSFSITPSYCFCLAEVEAEAVVDEAGGDADEDASWPLLLLSPCSRGFVDIRMRFCMRLAMPFGWVSSGS